MQNIREISPNSEAAFALFNLRIVRIGLPLALFVFYFTTVSHFDYTPDDTYIYLQYAKNISSGEGFSFNQGIPSYGTTGPLWALLIASGMTLGLDPYIVAKTLDLVFASLSILIFFTIAVIVLRDTLYGITATLLFSFDVWMLRWSGSGMEGSLAVLLALAAFRHAYRNEYALASFVSAVLTLIRPEGALFFLILMADNFLNSTKPRLAARVLGRSVLLYGMVLIPWIIFAYLHIGTIVPNTFAAKSGTEFTFSGLGETLWSIVTILGASQAIPLLLVFAGTPIVIAVFGWSRIRSELLPWLWVIALIAFYSLESVQVVSRYLLLIIPFVILQGLWVMKRFEESLRLNVKKTALVLGMMALISLAQNQYVYQSRVLPHLKQFVIGMNQAIKPIAYWLKEHSERQARVLAPDIGLVAYVSDRTIYDVAGLVTPEVREVFLRIPYDVAMREGRYELVIKPDYIIYRSPTSGYIQPETLSPIMTTVFPGLGITKQDVQYYTLYRDLQ